MPKKTPETGDHPLRETEDAAYHAFREWPVFLVLRQKTLEAHQKPANPEHLPPIAPAPFVGQSLPDAIAALKGKDKS